MYIQLNTVVENLRIRHHDDVYYVRGGSAPRLKRWSMSLHVTYIMSCNEFHTYLVIIFDFRDFWPCLHVTLSQRATVVSLRYRNHVYS